MSGLERRQDLGRRDGLDLQSGVASERRPAGNQRVGTYEDNVLAWRRYDALPKELRRVYDLAPFKMHMGGAHKRLAVYATAPGATVETMRKAEIFFLCKLIQERALEEYGPDHPDAQRSRLEGQARRTMRPTASAGGGRR